MAVCGILLTACAGSKTFATFGAPGSDPKEGVGVCSAFDRPPYQILGQTAYDQLWANRIVEAGVAGCAWPRPAERPAALDKVPTPKSSPVKKMSRWQKAKTKLHKKKIAQPVDPTPAPVATATPATVPGPEATTPRKRAKWLSLLRGKRKE